MPGNFNNDEKNVCICKSVCFITLIMILLLLIKNYIHSYNITISIFNKVKNINKNIGDLDFF